MTGFWIGMVGACFELSVAAWRRWVLGKMLFVGEDFWWVVPLLAGAIVGVATVVTTAMVPRRFSALRERARFTIPIALASLGVLWLFPSLDARAAALLAAGIGLFGGERCAARAGRVDLVATRSLPAFGLVPLLLCVVMHWNAHSLWERRDAPGSEAPNVLLLVLDTVRAIELGLYGFTPSTSPALDGLGAAGVVFDNAISTAPWSAPSHASLFTGRLPAELSIDWDRRLDNAFPTLAEQFQRMGYATVGIVGNTAYTSAETGLARGFDRYEDYPLTWRRAITMPGLTRRFMDRRRHWMHDPPLGGAGRVSAQSVSRRLVRWLEQNRSQPYFAFLNFYDAHGPYLAPDPFWSRYLPGEPQRAMSLRSMRRGGPSEAPVRRAYDAAISNLDSEIGALIGTLIERGLLNNTLVVITADHGEEFNEHAALGHGQTLYTQALRVPLILFWPGHLAPARVMTPVSLARVPATIMELLGERGPFPGPSLLSGLGGDSAHAVAAFSSVSHGKERDRQSIASVHVGQFHFIQYPGDSTGRLYDHATDPLETRDLAGTPDGSRISGPLRESLMAMSPAPASRKGGHHD